MKIITALAAILLFAAPAHGQTFKVLSGSAFLTRDGKLFKASRGNVLKQGDRLVTGGDEMLTFALDYGAGFGILFPLGQMELAQLTRFKGCVRNDIYYRGRLRVQTPKFSCPFSIIRLNNLSPGHKGSYAITGTDVDCRANPEKMTCLVSSGDLESKNVGVIVEVPAKTGNFIKPGQPPSPPVPIDQAKVLASYRIDGKNISGTVNPLNSLEVNGKKIGIDDDGNFKVKIKRPFIGNAIYLKVTDGFGAERIHLRDRPNHPF